MRTTLLIAGGSILFGFFLLLADVFGDGIMDPAGFAIKTFVGLWLFAASANLWLGLMEAGPGHSFMEEFPRFLAVLSVPIALAVMFPWHLMIIG
jgi:hypothetical protein